MQGALTVFDIATLRGLAADIGAPIANGDPDALEALANQIEAEADAWDGHADELAQLKAQLRSALAGDTAEAHDQQLAKLLNGPDSVASDTAAIRAGVAALRNYAADLQDNQWTSLLLAAWLLAEIIKAAASIIATGGESLVEVAIARVRTAAVINALKEVLWRRIATILTELLVSAGRGVLVGDTEQLVVQGDQWAMGERTGLNGRLVAGTGLSFAEFGVGAEAVEHGVLRLVADAVNDSRAGSVAALATSKVLSGMGANTVATAAAGGPITPETLWTGAALGAAGALADARGKAASAASAPEPTETAVPANAIDTHSTLRFEKQPDGTFAWPGDPTSDAGPQAHTGSPTPTTEPPAVSSKPAASAPGGNGWSSATEPEAATARPVNSAAPDTLPGAADPGARSMQGTSNTPPAAAVDAGRLPATSVTAGLDPPSGAHASLGSHPPEDTLDASITSPATPTRPLTATASPTVSPVPPPSNAASPTTPTMPGAAGPPSPGPSSTPASPSDHAPNAGLSSPTPDPHTGPADISPAGRSRSQPAGAQAADRFDTTAAHTEMGVQDIADADQAAAWHAAGVDAAAPAGRPETDRHGADHVDSAASERQQRQQQSAEVTRRKDRSTRPHSNRHGPNTSPSGRPGKLRSGVGRDVPYDVQPATAAHPPDPLAAAEETDVINDHYDDSGASPGGSESQQGGSGSDDRNAPDPGGGRAGDHRGGGGGHRGGAGGGATAGEAEPGDGGDDSGDSHLTTPDRSVLPEELNADGAGRAPIPRDDDEPDPYRWLEDPGSTQRNDWVEAHSEHVLAELTALPEFAPLYQALLDVLKADGRLDEVRRDGEWVYRVRHDADHSKGLWQRARFETYIRGEAHWQDLLDLDALSTIEKKNFVWWNPDPWHHAFISPDGSRALIFLSPGGADHTEVREFDMVERRIVSSEEGGFYLPPLAVNRAAWGRTNDDIYFSTDLGAGSLTQGNVPRIAKRWRRGQTLQQSETLLEGEVSGGIVVAGYPRLQGMGSGIAAKWIDFFNVEYYRVDEDGSLRRLEVPTDATASWVDDRLLIELKSVWAVGDKEYPAGSLLYTSLERFMAGNRVFEPVFVPDEHVVLEGYGWTKNHLLLTVMTDVQTTVQVATRTDDGHWPRRPLCELPPMTTTTVSGLDPLRDNRYLLTTHGFDTPSTVRAGTVGEEPVVVERDPDLFDKTHVVTKQYFARSEDGTLVPYFVTYDNDKVFWPAPTLVRGYGGFGLSQKPEYDPIAGAAWISQGGVLVTTCIRGGGEYGPQWHTSVQKANRHKVYEDFIAVAEDLVRRPPPGLEEHLPPGVTIATADMLGATGASNGGLMMLVMANMRPDLFEAIVSESPQADMRRYTKLGQGANWIAEYGDPDTADWDNFIKDYSPYHNTDPNKIFTNLLMLLHKNDDRVVPAHAEKMTALYESQGRTVLHFETSEGGHNASVTPESTAQEQALFYAFLRHHLFP